MPTPPIDTDPQAAEIETLYARGLALHQQGQIGAAEQVYRQVLARAPGHAQALGMLGVAALQQRRFAAAAERLGLAAQADPADAVLHANLGLAQHELGQFEAALASYERSLALAPGDAGVHFNRGNTLRALDRPEAAVASYERAIALNPDFIQAHCNRASALSDGGRLQSALEGLDHAIGLRPDIAELHLNRGNVLQDLGRLDEAIPSFDRAIALVPAHADARWNRALALLLSGDLRAGWRDHEWRRQHSRLRETMRRMPQPPWLGETPLQGRRVLLHAEQGYGDIIQFCRYAKLVQDRGARVLLTAPPALVELLRTLDGVDELLTDGEPLPGFDRHCPLMSLPLAFDTTLDTIPSPQPYLKADPARVERWAARLGPRCGPRVGLVWSGSLASGNDPTRSIALSKILAHLPDGPDYVSLQKDVRPHDRAALDTDGRILDLADEIADFADTAALCALMDVVVSVDTSVAHLAGALGRPTWVLLRYASEWRWLLEREDSPWYASVRLLRQGADGDWEPVLRRLGANLGNLR